MTDKEQYTVNELSIKLNGVLDKITTHIEDGKGWRFTIAGIAVGLIIQIISFAFFTGALYKQVQANTRCLEKVGSVCEEFKIHRAKDEARWDVYPMPKAIK